MKNKNSILLPGTSLKAIIHNTFVLNVQSYNSYNLKTKVGIIVVAFLSSVGIFSTVFAICVELTIEADRHIVQSQQLSYLLYGFICSPVIAFAMHSYIQSIITENNIKEMEEMGYRKLN